MAEEMSAEQLVRTTLCEVVEINEGKVKIRIRGYDDGGTFIVQGSYPIDLCPEPARIVGGAFYVDTYKRKLENNKVEYAHRSRTVDEAEEATELDRLLGIE